jgi:hypothetical protein
VIKLVSLRSGVIKLVSLRSGVIKLVSLRSLAGPQALHFVRARR